MMSKFDDKDALWEWIEKTCNDLIEKGSGFEPTIICDDRVRFLSSQLVMAERDRARKEGMQYALILPSCYMPELKRKNDEITPHDLDLVRDKGRRSLLIEVSTEPDQVERRLYDAEYTLKPLNLRPEDIEEFDHGFAVRMQPQHIVAAALESLNHYILSWACVKKEWPFFEAKIDEDKPVYADYLENAEALREHYAKEAEVSIAILPMDCRGMELPNIGEDQCILVAFVRIGENEMAYSANTTNDDKIIWDLISDDKQFLDVAKERAFNGS